jgi:hypothetical protein
VFFSHEPVNFFFAQCVNNDSLSDDVIYYVEKEEMKRITNDQVVKHFMDLKNRMYQRVKDDMNFLVNCVL